MTYDEFRQKISNLELRLLLLKDDQWGIKTDWCANPMAFFNPLVSINDWNGNVTFKAINSGIYTPTQIHETMKLVSQLMMTPLEKRGEPFKLTNV